MAYIFAKNGMLYLAYYVIGENSKRKRIRFSLQLKDDKENMKIAKRIKAEKEVELMRPNSVAMRYNMNLETAFSLFKKAKATVSYSSKTNYESMYKYFKQVTGGKIYLKDVNKYHVSAFEDHLRNKLGLSQNTVASYFKDLNTFWNWLIKEKFVYEKIPWRIPTESKPIKTIPDGDLEIIFDYMKNKKDQKHFRFIMFLSLTGMRVGEAISLRWEDIDFVNNKIMIKNSKGKRNDEFPLYYGLKEFINKFNQLSGPVFDFKNKDSTKFWNRALDDIEKLEGRKYTLHQLRKTFATQLVNKNVSVFDAMKLLRHKNINTTLKYYTHAELSRLGDEANKVFGNSRGLFGGFFGDKAPQTASNGEAGRSEKVLKLVKIKGN